MIEKEIFPEQESTTHFLEIWLTTIFCFEKRKKVNSIATKRAMQIIEQNAFELKT